MKSLVRWAAIPGIHLTPKENEPSVRQFLWQSVNDAV
jgi:hypothetical protein